MMYRMKRVYTHDIDLNAIPDTQFRRDMTAFFEPQKKIYISFHIEEMEEMSPEPEAGFPYGWVEVVDLEITEVVSQEVDSENEVVSEKEWSFRDLPKNIQDHILQLSFEACDSNPDWANTEFERREPRYSGEY